MSHPTWVRGLKCVLYGGWQDLITVAPHVGAWIEIADRRNGCKYPRVAPHVGAWIEISSRVGFLDCDGSHPTWVRGLKLQRVGSQEQVNVSHPTWVRGLK